MTTLSFIEQPDGTFVLGTTELEGEAMASRVVTQTLSDVSVASGELRGNSFIDALRAGRIKTYADIVGLFSAAAAQMLLNLRRYESYQPIQQIRLRSYEFVDARTIKLTIDVVSQTEIVTQTIMVL